MRVWKRLLYRLNKKKNSMNFGRKTGILRLKKVSRTPVSYTHLDVYKRQVLKLSKDTYLRERLGGKQVFLTERETQIVEYIQSIGYLQNQMFKDVSTSVSEDTILRDIHELIAKGIVKKVGKTKSARYVMV